MASQSRSTSLGAFFFSRIAEKAFRCSTDLETLSNSILLALVSLPSDKVDGKYKLVPRVTGPGRP